MSKTEMPKSTFSFIMDTMEIMALYEELGQPNNEGFGWEKVEE